MSIGQESMLASKRKEKRKNKHHREQGKKLRKYRYPKEFKYKHQKLMNNNLKKQMKLPIFKVQKKQFRRKK